MKKAIRRISLTVFIMVMAAAVLSGCGPKKPAPEDAQAYVKAILDLMCTGDYDHSVDIADIEEGKESEIRDAFIDEMVGKVSEESDLSEDSAKAFRDLMINALEKTRYSVGEATPAEDGEYDVTVSIEPLRIFTGVEEEFDAELEKIAASEPDKILAMSTEEQAEYGMEILLGILNKKIEDPKYDPAEEVTVHYGLMEGQKNVYGCAESEGEKLGSKLFLTKGL